MAVDFGDEAVLDEHAGVEAGELPAGAVERLEVELLVGADGIGRVFGIEAAIYDDEGLGKGHLGLAEGGVEGVVVEGDGAIGAAFITLERGAAVVKAAVDVEGAVFVGNGQHNNGLAAINEGVAHLEAAHIDGIIEVLGIDGHGEIPTHPAEIVGGEGGWDGTVGEAVGLHSGRERPHTLVGGRLGAAGKQCRRNKQEKGILCHSNDSLNIVYNEENPRILYNKGDISTDSHPRGAICKHGNRGIMSDGDIPAMLHRGTQPPHAHTKKRELHTRFPYKRGSSTIAD